MIVRVKYIRAYPPKVKASLIRVPGQVFCAKKIVIQDFISQLDDDDEILIARDIEHLNKYCNGVEWGFVLRRKKIYRDIADFIDTAFFWAS